jgi:hypothetical protein
MSGRNSVFELPIRLQYRPPLSLLYFLIFSHAAGVICVFHSAIPVLPGCFMCVVVMISFYIYLRDFIHARRNPVYLILQPDDVWLLIDRAGDMDQVSRVRLEPGSFVHPLLTVLRVNREGRRCSFVLTSGNTDFDILRRLRVRLRFPIS